MDTPITMSDNYRSGFLVRIKKVNGKTNSVWLEVSSHNANLDTTLTELSNLSKDMDLEEYIGLKALPKDIKPPKQADVEERPEPKAKPKVEVKNWRYVCTTCHSDIPAFASHPTTQSIFCSTCKKWKVHEKKVLE